MAAKHLIQIPDRKIKFWAKSGDNLFQQLVLNGLFQNDGSFCEGKRECRRCVVLIDGEKKLSCETYVNRDMTIQLIAEFQVKDASKLSSAGQNLIQKKWADKGELAIAIDIGTTTIQMAFCLLSNENRDVKIDLSKLREWDKQFPLNEGNCEFFEKYFAELAGVRLIEVVSLENPLVIYGRDVVSKIQFAQDIEKSKAMRELLSGSIVKEIESFLSETDFCEIRNIFISGNVAMITIFLGESTKSISEYPFHSKNLHPDNQSLVEMGADFKRHNKMNGKSNCDYLQVEEKIVRFSPAVSAFTGGDLISGLSILPTPSRGKYSIFLDIGTNTEVAVFSETEIFVSSTPAGPCFEGGNISYGMSAIEGAIYDFEVDVSGIPRSKVINEKRNVIPKGICGTGLIAIIAELRRTKMIDDNGDMKIGEKYRLTDTIYISQKDVREFQLAKSAIRTAISILEENLGSNAKNIDKVFIAGGFSTHISPQNLVESGILPKEYRDRCVVLGNTSLLGGIRSLKGEVLGLAEIVQKSKNINLALIEGFQEKFIQNINFNNERL